MENLGISRVLDRLSYNYYHYRMGYLFGILIAGMIVSSIAIDCYRSKDQMKKRIESKIRGLNLAIEKDKTSHKYEVEVINSDIAKFKKRLESK